MTTVFETIDRDALAAAVGGYTEIPVPPPPDPRPGMERFKSYLDKRGADAGIDPGGAWKPGNGDMDGGIFKQESDLEPSYDIDS